MLFVPSFILFGSNFQLTCDFWLVNYHLDILGLSRYLLVHMDSKGKNPTKNQESLPLKNLQLRNIRITNINHQKTHMEKNVLEVPEATFVIFVLGNDMKLGSKVERKIWLFQVLLVVSLFFSWDLSPAMTLGTVGGRNINLVFSEIQTTCTSCVEVKLNSSLLFFKAALPA